MGVENCWRCLGQQETRRGWLSCLNVSCLKFDWSTNRSFGVPSHARVLNMALSAENEEIRLWHLAWTARVCFGIETVSSRMKSRNCLSNTKYRFKPIMKTACNNKPSHKLFLNLVWLCRLRAAFSAMHHQLRNGKARNADQQIWMMPVTLFQNKACSRTALVRWKHLRYVDRKKRTPYTAITSRAEPRNLRSTWERKDKPPAVIEISREKAIARTKLKTI